MINIFKRTNDPNAVVTTPEADAPENQKAKSKAPKVKAAKVPKEKKVRDKTSKAKTPKADKASKKHHAKKANFISNMKIAPKLLTSFLIIALMAAGMGGYAAFNLQDLSKSAKQLHVNVLLPTENLASAVSNFQSQEIMLRSALVCTDELYTQVYISSIKNSFQSIYSQLNLIESFISEESRESYDQLLSNYDIYKQAMEDAFTKIESGDKDWVINDLFKGDLYWHERDVKKSFDDLQFSITAHASSTVTKNEKNAETVFLITLCAAGFVLLLSVALGILIALGISRPIKKLTANAKQLAAGEIDIEFAGTMTKDEIGQISEAFRKIIYVIWEMTQDTDMLITAAVQGDLSVRANVEKHEGAYRRIVEGINATLDAMVTPTVESAKALGKLAEGNLNVSVEGDFHGDFAIVKDALNKTVESLKGYIGEITHVMENIASGVLDTGIESEYQGDFVSLKESINTCIASFGSVLKEIDAAAEEVAQGTLLLSSGSQTISQGATEQASALEQLTASLSEISSETQRNAERAKQANERSVAAKGFALSGNEKMKALQSAMQEINTSSASISKIIKVIDDIAFQTNILALNAAVEAARAGEHGKGFAVVADEVRSLAARSANAAKETTDLIENSIKKTAAGTKIADETASALLEIVGEIEKTVTLSSEISQASSGQAAGIEQVGRGIEQLAVVVQTNSATAQEAAASSEELSSQAELLKNMVGRFQLKTGDRPAAPNAATHESGRGATPQGKIVLNDRDFGKY